MIFTLAVESEGVDGSVFKGHTLNAMVLSSNRQIWMLVALVNLLATSVIVPAILTLYPSELWQYELTLSLSLTYFIASPATYFFALQLKKNHELTLELTRLVNRDRLTDLSTRDHFYSRMEEDENAFGTSLMVDIDNFKQINDTHGHLVGDRVIREVANMLKSNVRKEDIVARFGGEEFLVFLKGKDSDYGYIIAERMRKSIESLKLESEGINLKVTVSIGASFMETMERLEQSIQEADKALYRAKTSGKNRTVLAAVGKSLNQIIKKTTNSLAEV